MANTAVREVFDRALELSADERFELAQLLLDEEDVEAAGWWERIQPEVERRLVAIHAGEAGTVSWDEVQRRVRDKLDGKRDSLR